MDQKPKYTTVRLSDAARTRLKLESVRRGITMERALAEAVEQWCDNLETSSRAEHNARFIKWWDSHKPQANASFEAGIRHGFRAIKGGEPR